VNTIDTTAVEKKIFYVYDLFRTDENDTSRSRPTDMYIAEVVPLAHGMKRG
jgi:hypothetical protein